jgi:type VI secretion system protein ImpJ
MSGHNKVVWSEGLFLRPQHFQQQERYLERYVETRCQALVPHSWGFAEVELERDLLSVGKFGLRHAAGVFPDGTPLRMPDDDPLPQPLDLDVQVRDQLVHLAVPLRRPQAVEVERFGNADELTRHQMRELDARDATSASADPALLEVGALRTRLLLAADVTPAYSCIPLARIVECRPDKRVVLDEQFIPTVLQVRAAYRLATFLTELLGLLRQRGEALGGQVAETGRGGAAEIANFLMLQAINRYEPLVAHYADDGSLHPEALYGVCASVAGELATFTRTAKRPPALPRYRHDDLQASFDPVIDALRDCFGKEVERAAIPIPVQPRRFGIHIGMVPDPTLYTTAVFILAARADVPAEEMRRRFPTQLKVGPVEAIRDLVNLSLPGVPVHPVPVAPRQIPYHAGFVYFEFDQSHELWGRLKTSGGIAMQIGGEFSGLSMEMWAIRSS